MKIYDIFRKLHIDRQASMLQKLCIGSCIKVKRHKYRKVLKKNPLSHTCTDSILIVNNLGGIGNAIEATPMIAAIKMVIPSCKITLLAHNNDLFDYWCIPDAIIKNNSSLSNQSFDYTIIPFWGYHILPEWILKAKFGKILTPKIYLNTYFLKPEREYNLDIVRKLGYKGATPPEYVSIKKPDIILHFSKSTISLLPCAKPDKEWNSKRWPYYADLINKIQQEYPNVQILIIGNEEDKIDGTLSFSEKLIDLRGKLSLAEVGYVLKNSALVIGNDCGPMHIADAVQAKCIALFGPTCPIKNKLQNRYCILSFLGNNIPCQYEPEKMLSCNCINHIRVDDVIREIKRELDN